MGHSSRKLRFRRLDVIIISVIYSSVRLDRNEHTYQFSSRACMLIKSDQRVSLVLTKYSTVSTSASTSYFIYNLTRRNLLI